jgi:hypothetical protein
MPPSQGERRAARLERDQGPVPAVVAGAGACASERETAQGVAQAPDQVDGRRGLPARQRGEMRVPGDRRREMRCTVGPPAGRPRTRLPP